MAFQALKEAKIPGAICRLTPPSSPSRIANTSGPIRSVYKSRILAALDAEFDALNGENSRYSHSQGEVAGKRSGQARQSTRSYSTLAQSSYNAPAPAEFLRMGDIAAPALNPKGKAKDMHTSRAGSINESPEEITLEQVPSLLPTYSYKDHQPQPAIVYTRHEEEANDLIECLMHPVGFDMEWRVQFRRDYGAGWSKRESPTAVVQLCDTKMVLVIQISAMNEFPHKLRDILESDRIWKCGVNIRNDVLKLYRDFGILSRACVELGAMARHADPDFSKIYKRNIVSLDKMAAMYLKKTLAKPPVRTSNWEIQPLSSEQVTYAANDAHAGLMILKKLQEVALEQAIDIKQKSAGYSVDLKNEHDSGKLANRKSTMAGAAKTRSTEVVEQSVTSVITVSAADEITVASVSETNAVFIAEESREETMDTQPELTEEQRYLQAYKMWYAGELSFYQICVHFGRTKAGVIMFVMRALLADPSLPYDLDRLRKLASRHLRTKTFFEEHWEAAARHKQ